MNDESQVAHIDLAAASAAPRSRARGVWGASLVSAFFLTTTVVDAVASSGCGSSAGSPSGANDGGIDGQIAVDPRPSATTSTIRAEPTTVVADRTTTTRLTVTIRRSDGSLVGDEPVVLTSTGKGNKFTPASGTTDKNGIFSATMASSIPEAKVVAATFDGVSVTTQVEFQRCQGALFLPTTSVPLGGTVGISTGDFNGDGTLDLATADTGSSLARVVLGKADGTFSAPVPYAVGANPGDMATGDFNSDGKPDLVSANYTAGTVSVLLAKADGTGFASAVNYAIGSTGRIATADFNSDGKPDLVSANQVDKTVSVLLAKADGTGFAAAPVPYAVAVRPLGVTTGDFNGDGKPDIATANGDDETVYVLLAPTNGTGFAPAVRYTAGAGANSITAGDFNRDRKSDLAIANYTSNTVSVLIANTDGTGTFYDAVPYNVGKGPLSITTGDFNGDGRPDLATANNTDNTVSILFAKVDGTGFSGAVTYAVGTGPVSITTGDFNGDGTAGLATANANDGSILRRSGCSP